MAFIKCLDNNAVLYTLSRDGKTINTIGNVLPNQIIRELKWSLDEQYIYYAVWMTINEGTAYIVDMDKKYNREICAEDQRFLNGKWLPDNQFAYIVTNESQTSQYGVGELRILDTDTWNYFVIFKTSNHIVSPFDLVVLGEIPIPGQ